MGPSSKTVGIKLRKFLKGTEVGGHEKVIELNNTGGRTSQVILKDSCRRCRGGPTWSERCSDN